MSKKQRRASKQTLFVGAMAALATAGATSPAYADMQIVMRESADMVVWEASGYLDLTDAVHPDPLDYDASVPLTEESLSKLDVSLGESASSKAYVVVPLDGIDGPFSDFASPGSGLRAGAPFALSSGQVLWTDLAGTFVVTPPSPRVLVPED